MGYISCNMYITAAEFFPFLLLLPPASWLLGTEIKDLFTLGKCSMELHLHFLFFFFFKHLGVLH
jgi:hypothetical protein